MQSARLCTAHAGQLVIVDLQTRLLSAMPEADRDTVIRTTEILLQATAALEIPTLYTEQYPKGLGPTVPAILHRIPAAARGLAKTGFSCCAADGFLDALKTAERRQIVIAGQEAHICVLQTALELTAEDFEVYVVEEGVCSRSAAHKHNALARMRDSGVTVTNLESILFEWLRDATHPQFKSLSKLIR